MRQSTSILLIAVVCSCTIDSPSTPPTLSAAGLARANDGTTAAMYELVRLPDLGNAPSRGSAINGQGWVAGFSTLPTGERHAAQWRNRQPIDLGTLGGPHSTVQWPGENAAGMVVGIAQTAIDEPLHEEWSCSAFLPTSGKVCLGFAWYEHRLHPMPTLGGNNSYAAGVNSAGRVVGWAETPVHDPTCNAPQVLQFRAVQWEPSTGALRQLPPLLGDSSSAATAINARGQVVGISGDCDVAVGRFSARHSVIWRDGKPSEIPNLGGEAWHTPTAVNEAGDVVGFSNPTGVVGGAFLPHAFLWNAAHGLIDLGLLPGDDNSQAFGINARRQVVGVSCKGSICRAFLWDNGVMTNLKSLMGSTFADSLLSARDINDAGHITGNVRDFVSGKTMAFVATPRTR
ncbi:MAG: hypothetical protein ABJE10_10020 [bacterium]